MGLSINRRHVCAVMVGVIASLTMSVQAQVLHWDPSDTGSQNVSSDEVWVAEGGGAPAWDFTSDSSGDGSNVLWASDATAVFESGGYSVLADDNFGDIMLSGITFNTQDPVTIFGPAALNFSGPSVITLNSLDDSFISHVSSIHSEITGSGNIDIMPGPVGFLRLGGSIPNTHTGLVTVTGPDMFLELDKTPGAAGSLFGSALGGDVAVNSQAEVVLLNSHQIADTSHVMIDAGRLTDNNNDAVEQVGSLTLTGGPTGGVGSGENSGSVIVGPTGTSTGAGFFGVVGGGTITTNASSDAAQIVGRLGLDSTDITVTVADGAADNDLEIWAEVFNVSGSGGLVKEGEGVLAFTDDLSNAETTSKSNTYTGTTTIHAGELHLERSSGTSISGDLIINGGGSVKVNNMDQIADTSDVTLNGGGDQAELDLSAVETINGLQMHGNAAVFLGNPFVDGLILDSGQMVMSPTGGDRPFVQRLFVDSGTQIWDVAGGGTAFSDGWVAEVDSIGGGGGLVNKTGSGRLRLDDYLHDGDLVVQQGTVILNDSTHADADVSVNANATLDLSDSVAGDVTINSDGLFHNGIDSTSDFEVLGNVDLDGTLLIDLDGSTDSGDLLTVGGQLDLTGATIDLNILNALDDMAYIFAEYDTLAGTPTLIDLPTGYAYVDNYNSANQLAIVESSTLVPAPSALPAGLALLAMLGWRRRRVAHLGAFVLITISTLALNPQANAAYTLSQTFDDP